MYIRNFTLLKIILIEKSPVTVHIQYVHIIMEVLWWAIFIYIPYVVGQLVDLANG